MQARFKVLLARWLARRIERRRRRLRRALRDYQRAELRRIGAAHRRARGLRLYAAWASGEIQEVDHATIVPLEPSRAGDTQKIRIVANIADAVGAEPSRALRLRSDPGR